MPPKIPLDLWWASIAWGRSNYLRPVVFLGHRTKTDLVVVRVSSKVDLRKPNDFLISSSHPDFPATGLTAESYAEAQGLLLQEADFTTRIGKLDGALRRDFESWLQGVPR